jgi:hypothetical protein
VAEGIFLQPGHGESSVLVAGAQVVVQLVDDLGPVGVLEDGLAQETGLGGRPEGASWI